MNLKTIQEILPNNTVLELTFVEGGTFLMGSDSSEASSDEQPVHNVQLSSFYMSKYPVTQAQWKSVMGQDNNPSRFKGDERPVENVNWHDTQEFCEKLKVTTQKDYRLPTEAEWEYAARGGQKSKGYVYAGSDVLKEVGWFRNNSFGETKPVGMRTANELGLYDMSGNVWEWCRDWYDSKYYESCKKDEILKDPQGPKTGSSRVLRGGSWLGNARHCRCSYRSSNLPGLRDGLYGFRVVLSLQSVG